MSFISSISQFTGLSPSGTKTSSYTLVSGDAGKYVELGTGGSIVIPTGVFASGNEVWLYNNTSSTVTITCSALTAYIAGTDSVQTTMILSARGFATILFNSSSACVVSGNVAAPIFVNYLVVAGGGGGGGQYGSGGGAGGFRTGNCFALIPGTTYAITVGAGGSGSAVDGATAGSDSVFSTITSAGGGRGRYYGGCCVHSTGGSGGSGGGGTGGNGGGGAGNTPATTPSQGRNGGGGSSSGARGQGGGGGASANGTNGTSSAGGDGGNGSGSTITGTCVTYAGGGGGSMPDLASCANKGIGGTGGGGNGGLNGAQGPTTGGNGTANLGGGAGGGTTGGSGGSGVVIISAPVAAAATTGSPTVTTSGGRTIYRFTATGSITF